MDKQKSFEDIEEIIEKAINKIQGDKDNDLCKYLPMSTGGYMHHFTLRKMKLKQPQELGSLIHKFILEPSAPSSVPPKARAARGSGKRRDEINFTKTQLDRLLNYAKLSGDSDIISVLSPRRSLAAIKRNLIQSIRQGLADQDLWDAYVDAISSTSKSVESVDNAIAEHTSLG